MPKYFILYGGALTRDLIFETDVEANTGNLAREEFRKFYPKATMVFIRKGRPFSEADKKRAKQHLR